MHALFITATGTNVGKTHTTLKLIEAYAKIGLKVGVFKPIETGVTDEPLDAKALLEACQKVNPDFANLTPADITAYTFSLPAAPYCADIQQEIKLKKIFDKYHELSKRCDLLLVEGAGGLMVPITQTYKMIDLAKDLNAPLLLVTPSRLGCINDTLLSLEVLHSRDIDFEWCVNLYEDRESFAEVTQPYYDAVFPGWWSVEKNIEQFVNRYAPKQ
ncbi:dethiobiotin synthase [Sulfurovum mangrovi]|uniref:dethiobiotin synthase n=1 Tax=Sulfurovum mangrovi TaxID=2893889 RepID=UPI001E52FD5C|nr:dethiobiotin synthase [Sulfurovum mangrovi]UFH58927.1 dethiobiotin synthase [Sulfurovum mangrovi]